MAGYRLSAKIIGRSSGRSSVAAAAYRAGAQLHDERTGLDHDYTRKNGVLHSEIMAPDNAPDWMQDRAKLWNAVEAVERRKDAQLAREIQLSLPHELDAQQNKNLVLAFIQSHFVDRGMIADVAIHAPDRQGDQRNIHAHVMLTTRVLIGDEFGKKDREWNNPEQLTEWRKHWAEHQNVKFRELGMEQRVDHRSFADQGIDREPMQHLGSVANDMERNGKNSRIGNENRLRQQRNAERAAQAQEKTQVVGDLAKEKAHQAGIVQKMKTTLHSYFMGDQIEMDRRHSLQQTNLDTDLLKRNSDRQQQLENQQNTLQQQLQSDGWRKLMRDLLGQTRRDQEQLSATQKNLGNIRQREESEREMLRSKQAAEKSGLNHTQREAEYGRKLETDRQAAVKQAAHRAQASPPRQNPANDRTAVEWSRAPVREQDNRLQPAKDFKRASEPRSKPVEQQPSMKKVEERAKPAPVREQNNRPQPAQDFKRASAARGKPVERQAPIEPSHPYQSTHSDRTADFSRVFGHDKTRDPDRGR